MSMLLVGGLAIAGGTAGYFGTSKKNRKKDGWKNAALGAVGGATLGVGAGALAGGAAASGGAGALASPALAGTQTGSMLTLGGGAGAAGGAAGLGGGATLGGLGSATTGVTSVGGGGAALGLTGTSPSSGWTLGGAGQNMQKFMSSDMGKQMMSQALGGGQQQQAQPSVNFSDYQPMQQAPGMMTTVPLAYAMQQENLRRYNNGLPY